MVGKYLSTDVHCTVIDDKLGAFGTRSAPDVYVFDVSSSGILRMLCKTYYALIKIQDHILHSSILSKSIK